MNEAQHIERRQTDPVVGGTERRSLAVDDFQIRAAGNNSLTLKGYASVFEYGYDIGGGPDRGGWTEVVDRRAFDQTLKQSPDVQLLINHDGTPLARTKSGTLTLSTDAKGLHVEARLDSTSPTVQVIRSAMERRDMDEMSFAFRTVRQDFDEDSGVRRLLELNLHKGDVSVVNYGASDATSAQLRTVTEALEVLASLDADAALAEVRSISDPAAALHRAQQSLGVLLRNVDVPRLSVADADAIIAAPRG
ncbi:MAG: HK97 family phage prohead protease [Actinomycetota bacterium]|nr:HK97 family phage prohead protease [Actinomycetota bacterium]